MNFFKKYIIGLSLASLLVGAGVNIASAITCTNTFPTSFNNYVSGNCIPSSWANSLENLLGTWSNGTGTPISGFLGPNKPLVSISNLATSSGNLIIANGTTWTVVASSSLPYLTTSTNLGVANFSSANISQWTNNVPYLTSSTGVTSFNGSTGAIAGVNSWGTATGTITYATSTGIQITQSGTQFTWANTGVTSFNGSTGVVTGVGSLATSTTGFTLANSTGSLSLGLVFPWTIAQGGTATGTTPASQNILIGNGANFTYSALPSCQAGQHLNYVSSTFTWTCTTPNVTFRANGFGFVSTTTIDLTAGANITITTSTAGVYTITGSAGGGGGGVATTTAYSSGYLQMVSSSLAITNSPIYSPSAKDISIGSTADNGILSIVDASNTTVFKVSGTTGATSSAVSLSVLGNTSSSSIAPVTVFQILGSGHINSTGTTPTISSCGTSPLSTSTDAGGTVQVGSVSATGCTITFKVPYEAKPSCMVTNQSMSVVNAMTYSISTTALTISQTGLTGAILNWTCGLYAL